MTDRTDIRRVLVANRGEIARRVFESCRRMGIRTVAVFSDADADAPFVAEADAAVPLGGLTAADSYLRGEAVIAAATRTGADAIHPGYGFAAENAEFARAVEAAGLVWIGPPPDAIEAMGSKVRARAMMEEADLPVLPGAALPDGLDPDGLAELAAGVGFPLLVKASAGGGGKGMRTVTDPAVLEAAVDGARREAEGAFGDGTVFLERFLERPRHVEIQVFADSHGNTVSLGERECSIQRRHQKVVEESPSPAVGPELRERMGAAAVAAAAAVGYRGAGTVEFLLGPDGDFYFLEMNARLQVEHPVTEMVTGLDLVRLQLLVAAGEELPEAARAPVPRGHAIEVRIYAEDAANDYLPQTGTVTAIEVDGAAPFAAPVEGCPPQRLRIDSGVEDGSEVSPHYDPMLAKLIAWAPSRGEAAALLASAIASSSVHGLVTNRDFLARVLRHEAFVAGDTDTGFLERHAGLAEPLLDGDDLRRCALAAALGTMAERLELEPEAPLRHAPPGWRNNPSQPQRISYRPGDGGDQEIVVAYALGRDRIEASVDGEPVEGVVLRDSGPWPWEVDLEAAGIRRRYVVSRYGPELDQIYVNSPAGQAHLIEQPRYPGSESVAAEGALVAPMPGKVIKLAVAEGAEVEAGDLIAVLEAMKMEHELVAPASGTLSELRVGEGDQVDSGSVLGLIDDG